MKAKEIDILWKIMDFFMLRFYSSSFTAIGAIVIQTGKTQYSKGFHGTTTLFFQRRFSSKNALIEYNPARFLRLKQVIHTAFPIEERGTEQ